MWLTNGAPATSGVPAKAFPQIPRRSLDTPLPAGAQFLVDLEAEAALRVAGHIAAWRPDGTAFAVARRRGLFAYFSDGTTRRLLRRTVGVMSWAANRTMAVSQGSRAIMFDEAGNRLAVLSAGRGPHLPIRLSPDGEYLLFGERIVRVSDRRRTATVPEARQAVWSPDSRRLVLVDGGDVFAWQVGMKSAVTLDEGWDAEQAVWDREPVWTADSRAVFIGTAVYGCCSIPVELRLSRVREFLFADADGQLVVEHHFEWVDLDSPAVSAKGLVAARSGSCRRYDVAVQGIPDNIPQRLPWPSTLRGEGPLASPAWVHGGEWLAYNGFDHIGFLDPIPHHEPRSPIDSRTMIHFLDAAPGGRFLEVHTTERNVAPGTDACHGGIAY
jgi:hypothetical protein